MVACAKTDSPPSSPIGPSVRFPPRMFAAGEEPVGVRVTPYHKSWIFPAILRSLTEDELEILKKSPFGKFISLADEPVFSGRFGRLLMSKQLKTQKKHEAWFLFAGKPVRFSLREFAIVTGLHCGKYPKRSRKKMRSDLAEKPYWPSLFGKLDTVPVTSVIRMLKKRTITDTSTRVKYACLALLGAVLLPTTHFPKISKDHAERIKNLDDFFAYPWGRLSFDMLMSHIKTRDEVSLSQDTLSVPGFGLALQLVMSSAVSALTEVVQEKSPDSEEYEDDEGDEEDASTNPSVTISLSPGHARELDSNETTKVFSIIRECTGESIDDQALDWSDEEEDPLVDTMVRLISRGKQFNNTMFTGGASKADVQQLRADAKAKKVAEMQAAESKSKRKKKNSATSDSHAEVDRMDDASSVLRMFKGEMLKMDEKINNSVGQVADLKKSFMETQLSMRAEIKESIEAAKEAVIAAFKSFRGDIHVPPPTINPNLREKNNISSRDESKGNQSSHSDSEEVTEGVGRDKSKQCEINEHNSELISSCIDAYECYLKDGGERYNIIRLAPETEMSDEVRPGPYPTVTLGEQVEGPPPPTRSFSNCLTEEGLARPKAHASRRLDFANEMEFHVVGRRNKIKISDPMAPSFSLGLTQEECESQFKLHMGVGPHTREFVDGDDAFVQEGPQNAEIHPSTLVGEESSKTSTSETHSNKKVKMVHCTLDGEDGCDSLGLGIP